MITQYEKRFICTIYSTTQRGCEMTLSDQLDDESDSLEDGGKDWDSECMNCGASPTVHPTGLCGPCCFGEAETFGGNW